MEPERPGTPDPRSTGGPSLRPLGAPAPRRGRSGQASRGDVPRWGWLEFFVLSQTFLPAMLFLPGVTPIRTLLRVSAFAIAFVVWGVLATRTKRPPGSTSFPARPWLLFSFVWLGLSILHPNSCTITSAAAQVALYVAVASPAFWAPLAMTSQKQLGRVIALLFLCNALSSLVGVAQVFRPEIFNPPVIPAMNNVYNGDNMFFESGGNVIMRPCGLTDSPGAVAPAGLAAALLGLAWALLPLPVWKRVASVGLAFVGMAAIYYTQVRLVIVMLGIELLTLSVLLGLRRDYRKILVLGVLGAVVILGASAWVVRSSGSEVTERLMTLFSNNPADLYQTSRGGFVKHAFEEVLWDYPLGYGLGWWGMTNVSFGDPGRISPIWVEVMWPAWIYDGGFPLLIGYVGALVVTMIDSARIALRCKDRTVAYWGSLIVAYNLGILATCFSFTAFLAPIGIQFWLLSAVLHAADAQVRAEARKKPALSTAEGARSRQNRK